MSNLAKESKVTSLKSKVSTDATDDVWTNIDSQSAQLACKGLGADYHLINENEWLTIASNVIDNPVNNLASGTTGLLLATTPEELSTTSVYFTLGNQQNIYNLVGSTTEWTDKQIRQTDNATVYSNSWQEYANIIAYNGVGDIEPPYGYSSANGIGTILTGDNSETNRGFIRGANGLYSLDLSQAPTYKASTTGFRCAK